MLFGFAFRGGFGARCRFGRHGETSLPIHYQRECLNEGHDRVVVAVVVVAVEDNGRVEHYSDPLLLNKARDGVLN